MNVSFGLPSASLLCVRKIKFSREALNSLKDGFGCALARLARPDFGGAGVDAPPPSSSVPSTPYLDLIWLRMTS
jgi:hypothetical protein